MSKNKKTKKKNNKKPISQKPIINVQAIQTKGLPNPSLKNEYESKKGSIKNFRELNWEPQVTLKNNACLFITKDFDIEIAKQKIGELISTISSQFKLYEQDKSFCFTDDFGNVILYQDLFFVLQLQGLIGLIDASITPTPKERPAPSMVPFTFAGVPSSIPGTIQNPNPLERTGFNPNQRNYFG